MKMLFDLSIVVNDVGMPTSFSSVYLWDKEVSVKVKCLPDPGLVKFKHFLFGKFLLSRINGLTSVFVQYTNEILTTYFVVVSLDNKSTLSNYAAVKKSFEHFSISRIAFQA